MIVWRQCIQEDMSPMDCQYTMVAMEDPLDLAEVSEEAGLAEVVDLVVAGFSMVGDRLILHNE